MQTLVYGDHKDGYKYIAAYILAPFLGGILAGLMNLFNSFTQWSIENADKVEEREQLMSKQQNELK